MAHRNGEGAVKYAILVIAAEGIVLPGSHTSEFGGEYIERFDPTYRFPIGAVYTTPDIQKAKHFNSHKEAFDFWNQQVGDEPRWDGKPNKPLTALTIEVVEVPLKISSAMLAAVALSALEAHRPAPEPPTPNPSREPRVPNLGFEKPVIGKVITCEVCKHAGGTLVNVDGDKSRKRHKGCRA